MFRGRGLNILGLAKGGCVFLNPEPNDRGSQPSSSRPFSPALALAGFVALCALVGISDAAVTATSVGTWYASLHAPLGTPPKWVFGPVWAALYAAMAVAAWLAWQRIGASRPLRLWGWQLIVNALWTPAFFGLRNPPLGFAVLAVLVVLVAITTRVFWRVRRAAGWLMLPYLAWACYAAYLNAGFWWLNDA